jgi:hypothetical protein
MSGTRGPEGTLKLNTGLSITRLSEVKNAIDGIFQSTKEKDSSFDGSIRYSCWVTCWSLSS